MVKKGKVIGEVYKSINDVNLAVKVYIPEGWKQQDRRPAILFLACTAVLRSKALDVKRNIY